MPPVLDSTVKRRRNPKLATPRVQLMRGEFSDSAYWFGPTCSRKRPAWPYTQILGCEARISAMPCTSDGGVSQAVHVPPSACHCSTMLWRRKSITEMVAALSEAMPAACRIHGSLKIFAAKILRSGGSGEPANVLCTMPAVSSCGRTTGSDEPGFELYTT